MPLSTEAVSNNHLQAAREGVDALMQDFSEESVLVTNDAVYRGLDETCNSTPICCPGGRKDFSIHIN